jgi:hypothetical protein
LTEVQDLMLTLSCVRVMLMDYQMNLMLIDDDAADDVVVVVGIIFTCLLLLLLCDL